MLRDAHGARYSAVSALLQFLGEDRTKVKPVPHVNLAVDIPGPAPTFQVFGKIVSGGLVEKRCLTPTVEWGAVEKLAEQV